jgi:hypothetical protein
LSRNKISSLSSTKVSVEPFETVLTVATAWTRNKAKRTSLAATEAAEDKKADPIHFIETSIGRKDINFSTRTDAGVRVIDNSQLLTVWPLPAESADEMDKTIDSFWLISSAKFS